MIPTAGIVELKKWLIYEIQKLVPTRDNRLGFSRIQD